MTTVSREAAQTFEQLMLDFLTHLERARGSTRNTREAYRVDLLQFGAFLARRGVGALAADHTTVAAFLEELVGDRATPPAAATLRRKAACLRSFYGHLHSTGMIERNPTLELKGPRLAKRRPQSLTRAGNRAAARPTARNEPSRAARPRTASAALRMWAARVGGDRARAP